MIDYFKRDMLGRVSNLHLNLAIQEGLNLETTRKAAFMCSVQVDFAKHGVCIKPESMEELRRVVQGNKPGFLFGEDG